MKDQSKTKHVLIQELASLRKRITELEKSESERKRTEGEQQQHVEGLGGNSCASSIIRVSGINVAWNAEQGTCTFEDLPVAMMWVDTTLAGLMSGVRDMVGTERFFLALQSEGRKSVEADWQVISHFPDFQGGFKAIANIAAVAGWGHWELTSLNHERRECRFRIKDSWEGLYQKSLRVCWGSGMLAGKMAGYCSKLFETNCWADQTEFIAKGDNYDEFVVKPSPRLIEKEIENLLASDEATRADMAVALRKLEKEIAERRLVEETLKRSEERMRLFFERQLVGMAITSPEKGWLQVNEKLCQMLGYSLEELSLRTWAELTHPEDLAADVAQFNRLLSGEIDQYCLEKRFIRKDGAVISTNLSVGCVRRHDASVDYVLALLEDITESKQAEEELRESEERWQFALEGAGDGVWDWNVMTNKVFFSRQWKRMLGFEDHEIGDTLDELDKHVHPEDRERVYADIKKHFAGETPIYINEHRVFCKDGTYKWILDRGKVISRTADGKPLRIIGTHADISGSKRAEDVLRRSQQLFSTLFHANPAAVIFSSLTDGKCVDANAAYARLTGYEREELIGKTTLELNIWNSSEERQRVIAELAEKGHMENIELTLRRKNGEWINTIAGGEVITLEGQRYILSFFFDITERKQAEWKLLIKDCAIASSFNAIAISDLDGNLTYVNNAFLNMWGYTFQEALNLNAADLASNKEEIIHILIDIKEKGFSHGESLAQRKDGSVFSHQFSASLISSSSGNPIAMLSIFVDITDHKREEEEKRRLEERLQHADKMESIGTLAGGIAHDFNNLLMGIQGYASLTLLDLDPSHPHYERLRRIEEQVQSGADLTKQLLGFARGGRYDVKPSDMNDILEKSSSMFGRTKKEISINRQYGEDLWPVEVDRGQMEQVFLNLYVNAWQAMPGGGEIYLETENVLLDDEQAVPYAIQPGRYVKISVTDTGTGMDEKTRERIFDPFFTTKGMGRGTGLGLATVYGIIKGHKGAIHVYSEPGHGTTFNIYLPASEREVVKEKTETGAVARGTETILLVDDEKMVLEVSREMLEFLGYRVYAAGSGQEALAGYMEKRKEIDLVILDMIMPGISGGETFNRLREINSDAKVLLSSGYSINGEAKTIMDRGCNGFIQKPFRLSILSEKVREMLD